MSGTVCLPTHAHLRVQPDAQPLAQLVCTGLCDEAAQLQQAAVTRRLEATLRHHIRVAVCDADQHVGVGDGVARPAHAERASEREHSPTHRYSGLTRQSSLT